MIQLFGKISAEIPLKSQSEYIGRGERSIDDIKEALFLVCNKDSNENYQTYVHVFLPLSPWIKAQL